MIEAQDNERYLVYHTQPIAVAGLIFIPVMCVVDARFSLLAITRLTAVDVSVYNLSIPDAGGSQPFIRESSGGDTPAPLHEE